MSWLHCWANSLPPFRSKFAAPACLSNQIALAALQDALDLPAELVIASSTPSSIGGSENDGVARRQHVGTTQLGSAYAQRTFEGIRSAQNAYDKAG
jgi:hypothetical protein